MRPEQGLDRMRTQLAIVGGGPAGMMLGLLMARAGVNVVVLEKHGDFLRDFRGDTVHPSTLEVIHELGLLDDFLSRPHQELRQMQGVIGGETVKIAEFSHVRGHCKFIALMPPWRRKRPASSRRTAASRVWPPIPRRGGSTSAPTSWSAATGGTRWCASRLACR